MMQAEIKKKTEFPLTDILNIMIPLTNSGGISKILIETVYKSTYIYIRI